MSSRALILAVGVAVAGILLGLGGPTLSASAGSARLARQPRTLFTGSRRIYAFALGADRITWVSRPHKRGRYSGCEMYVRSLRTGLTVRAPLPSTGCGVSPVVDYGPEVPVLVDGVAAWVEGSSCGISECFWKIATIAGGEAKARVVDSVDVGCPGPACSLPHHVGKAAAAVGPPFPRPSLAGNGNLLVYSTGNSNIDHVRRIVGRHTVPFAVPPGLGSGIDSLAVGGGAVEVVSTVLNAGDGCGCLDSPAWSPDGSKIAYLQRGGVPAVMNADGSARHDLSTTYTASQGPVWSPDGKQLAYSETSSPPYPEAIALVNADGSGAHEIGPGADPSWSPAGSKIAFANTGRCTGATAAISVMNPDGTNVQQLASFAPGPTCLGEGGIAWSPDGTRIAFSLNGELEVMNANGSNPHPLTPGDEPSWSPDSSEIVFHTYSDQLWVIGADGTGLRQLTQGPDDHPSWSPDGQTIVFSSDRNNPYAYFDEPYHTRPELYLVHPDGSNLRPLSFTKPAALQQQETFYRANGNTLPSLPGVPTLAGNVAAVASTNPSGGHEITLFDTATGAQLAVVQVGTGNAPFALGGADAHWIVFHLGRTISALNTSSHDIIRLTKAPTTPLGLSVTGHRVAWAENNNGHARIRALQLPN